jgi:nucleotide-binding universal stress UspA family protein
MMPFRKILLPVDYSDPCRAVVPYVKDMMRHFSSQVTLVHAYGLGALARSELAITECNFSEELRIIEHRRLLEFAAEMFPGQHVESIVDLGEAGGIVDKVVQHQEADLIMLATHGLGPVRRFLLGSVAAKILHDTSAAIWTGTGSFLTGYAPRIPYRSILCALDDTDEARAVLKGAAVFASGHNAELSLVRVVEMPPLVSNVDFSPYAKDLIETANFSLRELKGELGVDAPHSVVVAAVADGVCQEAVRRNADLIVVGRGCAQTALRRMFSQLYSIVRQSPCPVLSI